MAQNQDADNTLHWKSGSNLLRNEISIPTINYSSAKIVMVGENCVGKSYLAHRIATGTPPVDGMINSTHGIQFWPLEPEQLSANAVAPVAQRRNGAT